MPRPLISVFVMVMMLVVMVMATTLAVLIVVMMLMLVIMAAALAVLIMVMMVLLFVIVVMAAALAVLIVVMMVLMLVIVATALAVLIMVMMVLVIVVMAAALAIFLMLTVEVRGCAELSENVADKCHNALLYLMEIDAENDVGGTNLYGAGRMGAILAALYLYGCANGGDHDRLILVPGYKTLDVTDENIVLIGPAVGFFHTGNHCGNKLIRAVGSGKLHIKISGYNASFIVKPCAYIYMYHFFNPSLSLFSREWAAIRQGRWAYCPR